MNGKRVFVMTRQRTWMLTAISVALFVLLIGIIVLAGWYQASRLPEEGVSLSQPVATQTRGQVEDPIGWRLLLGNVFFALLWLPVRFFVGRDWLSAGWHKVTDPEWTQSGAALQAYWERAA